MSVTCIVTDSPVTLRSPRPPRAAHLIVDDAPPIFVDTLASTLLGDRAEELIGFHRARRTHFVLSSARAQAVCRARYIEDRLAEAVHRGITQYVILGAGLDSFAYRSSMAKRIRVFEVDHPVTQTWKRRALSTARVAIPETVTFVPIDLETDSLGEGLLQGGVDPSRPALVSWPGVTMYLTQDAIARALTTIGGLAPGTELLIDYLLPSGLRDAAGNIYVNLVGPMVADHGEPWRTFLTPDDMTALLAQHGFSGMCHVRQHDAVAPTTWSRADALRPIDLSVLTHATVR